MPAESPEAERLESDVDTIKKRFGPLAEVYAESRSEAAGMAGNEAGEQHWKTIADRAEDDGQ